MIARMRVWNSLAVPTIALAICAGCGAHDAVTCAANSDCLQGGVVGTCLPAPSGTRYCAFDDDACPSGERWGVLAGEGLAETCVQSVPDGGLTDAAVDAGAPDAQDDVPLEWGAPSVLLGVNNDGPNFGPFVTPDGLTIFFARQVNQLVIEEIFVATRSNHTMPFGTPSAVVELNATDAPDGDPTLSVNTLEVVFARDGLMRATRSSPATAWSNPMEMGFFGLSPDLSSDGLTLYFTNPAGCTGLNACYFRANRATRSGSFGPATEVVLPAGTPHGDIDVSDDGRFLLLSGNGSPSQLVWAKRASTNDEFESFTPVFAVDPGSGIDDASWGPGLDIYFSLAGEIVVSSRL